MDVATDQDAESSDPLIVTAEAGMGSGECVIVAAEAGVICENGCGGRRVKISQVQVIGTESTEEAVATFANGGERRLK